MTEDLFHLGIKALIRNQKGNILLLQVNPKKLDGKDYWDLPGGRVAKGDSVETTLQRELLEETGIVDVSDIQPISMVLSNIRIPVREGETVGLILSVYACTIPEDAQINISDEHIAYQWAEPEQALRLLEVKYPRYFVQLLRRSA